MKLWNKGYTINNLVEKFTVGKDRKLDLYLAPYDVQGSIAHVKMLESVGLLTSEELKSILAGLKEIQKEISEGNFTIEEEFEDIHSKVEHLLTKKIGENGKKIHSARSRNDQVLVDLHLYSKAEIKQIKELTYQLFEELLTQAEKHKDTLIAGYTHMQIAMPSSIGLWLSAYAESLIDDVVFLNAAFQICDQNPLGSAAGYGSSFPIDREMTTKELGFNTLKYNSIAAQMSRGKTEKSIAFALSSLAGTLAKFSADVCLYMCQNFGFIGFPKELTTGSSIMPHKQNPDVFELIRAKCNKIQTLPVEFTMICNNLNSGYHRDFQLLKESLIGGIESMKECLEACTFMIQHIEVKENILDDKKYEYLYSVEEVNKLVLEGKSFRDAYLEIGQQVLKGEFSPQKEVNHTHIGSVGNLALGEIKEKMKKFMAEK